MACDTSCGFYDIVQFGRIYNAHLKRSGQGRAPMEMTKLLDNAAEHEGLRSLPPVSSSDLLRLVPLPSCLKNTQRPYLPVLLVSEWGHTLVPSSALEAVQYARLSYDAMEPSSPLCSWKHRIFNHTAVCTEEVRVSQFPQSQGCPSTTAPVLYYYMIRK